MRTRCEKEARHVHCSHALSAPRHFGEVVHEDATPAIVGASYTSFVPRKGPQHWSLEETKRFYEALRQMGTDFCSMEAYFEDMGEGNTETVACRITPSAKEYLQAFAAQHGYENISACMKSLLYNGSRYFTQNELLQKQIEDLTSTIEKQAVTIQQNKSEIERLKDGLNSHKTAHIKQKREIQRLTNLQAQSFYMGDYHTEFRELTTKLKSKFGEAETE